jgi:CheY-like chemotaxis protein
LLLVLAVLRAVFHPQLSELMDNVFFSLVGGGLALVLLPIERLASVKAAGFELSLTQPQIAGAIAASGRDRIKSDELRAKLSKLEDLLPIIRGSRVLWVDDNPHTILGERRVLRALGVDVTSVTSSLAAEEKLRADNDFDLVISDIQRAGDTYKITGGEAVHEGVNLVVKLRTQYDDPVIKSMPVIFYAAYDRQRLVAFTRRVRELQPEAEIANSILELLPKAVSVLAESRSIPMVPASKEPTLLETPTGRTFG